MLNISFLFGLYLVFGVGTKAGDISHFVEGNSTLVVMYDLVGVEEKDFVYVTMSYEYYDVRSSRHISVRPAEGAIKGANDDNYRQITKAEAAKGSIKNCVITWDLEMEAFEGLPAGEVILEVWTIDKSHDRDLWKYMRRKEKLNTRWLEAHQKGRHRKAKRLEKKLEKQERRGKGGGRYGCPAW